jgi:hypothetical protein
MQELGLGVRLRLDLVTALLPALSLILALPGMDFYNSSRSTRIRIARMLS